MFLKYTLMLWNKTSISLYLLKILYIIFSSLKQYF